MSGTRVCGRRGTPCSSRRSYCSPTYAVGWVRDIHTDWVFHIVYGASLSPIGTRFPVCGDTGFMDIVPIRVVPEQHHWINTIVGLLDQAFSLTDDEQVFAIGFVNKLLNFIQVPDRGDPAALPIPVVLEVSAHVYSTQLGSARDLDLVRPIRAVRQGDVQVSVETWVEALLSLVLTAYPDLSPAERLVTAKSFRDLLDSIGVPDRAASFLPDDVVRISRDVDSKWW